LIHINNVSSIFRPHIFSRETTARRNTPLATFPRLAHNSLMADVKNRCLVAAAAIVMSLTADALAQLTMPGIDLSADRPQLTKEEQEKRKAVDDAYKSTLNKLPDKKKPADPWGDIRSPAANSSRQR
jgi:hypothetical protein